MNQIVLVCVVQKLSCCRGCNAWKKTRAKNTLVYNPGMDRTREMAKELRSNCSWHTEEMNSTGQSETAFFCDDSNQHASSKKFEAVDALF
jgi:hypothetical protein